MKNTLLFLLLHIAAFSSAQTSGIITGTISNGQRQPLDFTTVTLRDSKSVVGMKYAMTDSSGHFKFTDLAAGNYLLEVIAIGYAKNVSDTIKLTPAENVINRDLILQADPRLLNEVVVVATRPIIEQKADRMVFNVAGTAMSGGATGLEVLQKVPGITIVNDRIRLSGKGGVTIMLNGKPSPYTDMEAVLKDIPAVHIDKIEIISNPGAGFDASGSSGILNLVLLKNTKRGISGNYSLAGGYSTYHQLQPFLDQNSFHRYSGAGSLNYQSGRWDAYASADFLHRYVFEVNDYNRIIGRNNFYQQNFYPYFYNTINYRTGFSYLLNKKNTIGLNVSGNGRDGNGTSETLTNVTDNGTNAMISDFITKNTRHIKRFSLNTNLNYTYKPDSSGREFNADLDYTYFKYRTAEDIDILPDNIGFNQLGENPLYYLTLKANYIVPLTNLSKLSMGFKFSHVDIDNRLSFLRNGIVDTENSNSFNYLENVRAGYVSLDRKTEKIEYSIGLRAEQTSTSGALSAAPAYKRNYINLFPTVSLSGKVGDNSKINFSYSKRIDRPNFTILSPFRYYIDSLTFNRGNPDLQPQFTHGAKLTFQREGIYFISLSYNHIDNAIFENAPVQIGDITYMQPGNLGRLRNIGAQLNLPYQLGTKVSGFADVQSFYNSFYTRYLDEVFDKSRITMLYSLNLSYKVSPSFRLEANGFYNGRSRAELMSISPFSGVSVGFNKMIWKERGRISFSANDLFYKNGNTSTVDYANIRTRYVYRDDSRNFRISFGYSFGGKTNRQERPVGSQEESERL